MRINDPVEDKTDYSLEDKIGYEFQNKTLLKRALTHSSYANERSGMPHYQLLEFLGDSILGFLVAEELIMRKPLESEGRLSQIRAAIVCERSLAECARQIGVGPAIRLGKNMDLSKDRKLDSILSDVVEALFAAVYLDGGIENARDVIKKCLGGQIESSLSRERVLDNKTTLQEMAQELDKNVKIDYKIIETTGPAHMRRFKSNVAVNGRVLGIGSGSTKKESEQNAAKLALKKIESLLMGKDVS